MKVVVFTRAEEFLDDYDYRSFVRVEVDGEVVFSVSDGEPEDSNLGRDFSDCFNVDDLMVLAYTAGRQGETLDISYEEVED